MSPLNPNPINIFEVVTSSNYAHISEVFKFEMFYTHAFTNVHLFNDFACPIQLQLVYDLGLKNMNNYLNHFKTIKMKCN